MSGPASAPDRSDVAEGSGGPTSVGEPRAMVVLLQALVVAVVSGGLAVLRFRAWEQSYSVALRSWGTDSLQMAAVVRSIHDTGWYFTNPHIGAPFGQQLYDFPLSGESLQIAAVRLLTLVSHRPFWVMNVYFLMGFAAVAFVSYLVLAHLRFRFWTAAPIAVLYAWLPYHLLHGEFHFFRSTYLSAPIAIVVVFWVLSWKDRFLVDPDGPVWGLRRLWRNLRLGRVMGAIALCMFIGSFETMVMAFTMVALVVSALIVAVRHRDIGDVGSAALAAAVIAATFGLLFIPNLLYKQRHGPNESAARRYPAEQVMYGLQISNMVLPSDDHPVAALSHLVQRTEDHDPVPGEAGQTLGTLGTIGFLALLYGVVAHRLDVRAGVDVFDRRRLWVQSGLVSLVLVLFATLSGFALVLSLFGFAQVRVWNRVVILIAFLAMLMVAVALERVQFRLAGWLRNRRSDELAPPGRALRVGAGASAVMLALAVTSFGLWDTRTRFASSSTNAADNQQAHVLRNLDAEMTRHVGRRGMIFQLPVMPYPESTPINDMADYDPFLPYLFSDGLRFSYGATRGRPDADWQNRVDGIDPRSDLAGLVGLGFDGILVDTYGYSDRGATVSANLDAALGPPVVRSSDGRWLFWDFGGYGEKVGMSAADLHRAATILVGPALMNRVGGRG